MHSTASLVPAEQGWLGLPRVGREVRGPSMGVRWSRDGGGEAPPRLAGDVDYLVIGAGPAGLQAAYFLKHFGLDYAVVEASAQAHRDVGHCDVLTKRWERSPHVGHLRTDPEGYSKACAEILSKL